MPLQENLRKMCREIKVIVSGDDSDDDDGTKGGKNL